jgi:hypothetical protein
VLVHQSAVARWAVETGLPVPPMAFCRVRMGGGFKLPVR